MVAILFYFRNIQELRHSKICHFKIRHFKIHHFKIHNFKIHHLKTHHFKIRHFKNTFFTQQKEIWRCITLNLYQKRGLLTCFIYYLHVQQRHFWGVTQWSVDIISVRTVLVTCFIFPQYTNASIQPFPRTAIYGKGMFIDLVCTESACSRTSILGVRQWFVDLNCLRAIYVTCFIFSLLYKHRHTATPTDRSAYFVENIIYGEEGVYWLGVYRNWMPDNVDSGVMQCSVDVNCVRAVHVTCFTFSLLYKPTHTAPPTDRSTYLIENTAVWITNIRWLFKS